MATKVIVSEKWKVSSIEWIKSAGYAVGTTVLYEAQKIIQTAIDTGVWDLQSNLKTLATIALSAFGLFVIGKWVAPASVKTTYSNNSHAKEVAQDIIKNNEIS